MCKILHDNGDVSLASVGPCQLNYSVEVYTEGMGSHWFKEVMREKMKMLNEVVDKVSGWGEKFWIGLFKNQVLGVL